MGRCTMAVGGIRAERMDPADAAWLHTDRPANLMVVNTVLWFDAPVDQASVLEVFGDRVVSRFRGSGNVPRTRRSRWLRGRRPSGSTTLASCWRTMSAGRGCRRRGTRGHCSEPPATWRGGRCGRNSRTSPGWSAADRMPGDPGDPGQAEGCQPGIIQRARLRQALRPRNVVAEPASAFPVAGRSKVRLPGMSAPRHAVTLSDAGGQGERAHCRRCALNLAPGQ